MLALWAASALALSPSAGNYTICWSVGCCTTAGLDSCCALPPDFALNHACVNSTTSAGTACPSAPFSLTHWSTENWFMNLCPTADSSKPGSYWAYYDAIDSGDGHEYSWGDMFHITPPAGADASTPELKASSAVPIKGKKRNGY